MSYKDVKDKAAEVRDELNESDNTAYRVGSLLIEIAELSEAEDAAFRDEMKGVKQDATALRSTLSTVQTTQSSLLNRVGALETADIIAASENERRHAVAVVSAAPFDTLAEGYPPDVQQNSLTRNFTVVWFPDEGRFLGLSNGKYFDNWMAWKQYPARDVYMADGAPIVGRLYRQADELYAWTGTDMVALYASLREDCAAKYGYLHLRPDAVGDGCHVECFATEEAWRTYEGDKAAHGDLLLQSMHIPRLCVMDDAYVEGETLYIS